MLLFYSARTGGFYSDAHPLRPDDAVEISAERHAELLDAQSAGMRIVAGSDGRPQTAEPIKPDDATLLAGLRRERDRRLAASDFSQMPDAPLDDQQQAAWRTYRQALRDLPETATDLTAIEWPVPPA